MTPKTLILRTAGTNCDAELAYAFEQAGATTQTIHIAKLIEQPDLIGSFDLIGFPGGFSYGDDIAAGRILANRLKHRLLGPLQDAANRGVPMIGICNGFQVLVKLGLLPFHDNADQVCTLADNISGRFACKWGQVVSDEASRCIWTQGLGAFELPIAHGEGRFTALPQTLDQLKSNNQVALRYAAGANPNGSDDDIAGICDPSGVIFGLMPHPERYVTATQHPQWTRQGEGFLTETMPGLKFFQNAVSHVRERAAASV
ncbi:MAG: phosphoribosylformylglycinamidine synthase subunit PurQ [Phycisphaeraceae bacterium]|nr:phosphoribosylformylglycinamidine synthase subunit PurQ [Phycisphaeraceae bacterium]